MKNKFELVVKAGRKFIALPFDQPRRRDGKWARERTKRLIEEVFPDVELTKKQYLTLMGQLSGWLAVARFWTTVGNVLAADVIVDDPRKGVDSFIVYMTAKPSPELNLPQGIDNYDIHATELAAPRVTEVFDHHLGPAAFSYSLRHSEFNGAPAITRNVEYFIMVKDYPMVLTYHQQWADPNEDAGNRLVAEKLSNGITLINRD